MYQEENIEKSLRILRHKLTAVYDFAKEEESSEKKYELLRLIDDYLPKTIESSRAAIVSCEKAKEDKQRTREVFKEQIQQLCLKYEELAENIREDAKSHQETNGRFIKSLSI